MGYRRQFAEAKHWNRLKKHLLESIDTLGLPVSIVEDSRAFGYVLDHGHDPESGWSTRDLAHIEARALLAFLETQGTGLSDSDLAVQLRTRLASTAP